MYLTRILRSVSQFSHWSTRRMSLRSNIVQNPGVEPDSRMIWVDLELSGLSFEKDVILEAACIITEANLDEVGERISLVIHHPSEILDNMDPWCIENHGKSGLIHEVRNSAISLQDAEARLLEHVRKYTLPGKRCLAGSTVYMDRFFLNKRWDRSTFTNAPQKTYTHRALDDILESIAELRYYKQTIFDK